MVVSRNVGRDDIQTRPELNKHRSRQTLGEDVGELRCGWHMQNTYISSTDTLADEMEINLHMLRALMLNRIWRQVDSTHIVAIDKGAAGERLMEFMNKLMDPTSFGDAISDGSDLRWFLHFSLSEHVKI